jgi:hypothetical protein
MSKAQKSGRDKCPYNPLKLPASFRCGRITALTKMYRAVTMLKCAFYLLFIVYPTLPKKELNCPSLPNNFMPLSVKKRFAF